MNLRIGDEPEPGMPDDESMRLKELDRMPQIEAAYARYLEPGALSPSVERNVAIYQQAIADEVGGVGSEAVREAWVQHRIEEVQPEDHRFSDKLQLDYAIARNVAYARELEARLQAESRPSLHDHGHAPEVAPLRPEPLMLERLRELRAGNPQIDERVERDKSALVQIPGLDTPEARREALQAVQAQMRAAVDAGDKTLERQLRIRVLALDDLVQEATAPQLDEPTERLPPRATSSAERLPIHRRDVLGLPPAINNTEPTMPRQDPDATLPAPVRHRDPSTPGEPEGMPIHRLSSLQGNELLDELEVGPDDETSGLASRSELPTMPPPSRAARESSLLAEMDEPDEPEAILPDADTRPGRNRTPVSPPAFTREVTAEVSIGDIVVDDLDRDTQQRFDEHFKEMVAQRSLRFALRGDLDWLDDIRQRAAEAPTGPDAWKVHDARADLEKVESRIAYYQQREDNAAPAVLFTQYAALRRERPDPEATGPTTPWDRLALASLQHVAERRQAALANTVAEDLLSDLKNSPRVDDARTEAAVLMSAQEREFDEYPYTDRQFLSAELLRSYETDPEYARVCALMLQAQRAANTSYLLYEIEQDKPAYDAAQARVPQLLERPADEVDKELMAELAQARIEMVLAKDDRAAELAAARAREAALIYDVLPLRRGEKETGPIRSRMPT